MGQSLKKMKKGTSKGRRIRISSDPDLSREVKREPKRENVGDDKNNVEESNHGLMKIFVKVLQKPLTTFEVFSFVTVGCLKL